MAKATKTIERIETITYHLELTEEEAETLVFVMKRIGGAGATTPRGHTDKIAQALASCGVEEGDYLVDSDYESIYFMAPE